MIKNKRSVQQIKEKMRMLLSLIRGGKISKKKEVELQVEYCFLQREYELYYKQKR